jgi:hypothetical protein
VPPSNEIATGPGGSEISCLMMLQAILLNFMSLQAGQ